MQDYPIHSEPPMWVSCLPLVVGLVAFVYFAFCVYKIAQKAGVENPWMAWIPILNLVPLLEVAGKPTWWIILFFIPIANIVVAILVWMAVAEAMRKPSWVGVLIIVPCIGLFVPAYLAFSDSGPGAKAAP